MPTPDITQFPISTVEFPFKIVQFASDLADYLVGDEYILPAGVVMFLRSATNNGVVDIGANALRISTDTVLRGLSDCSVMSTNTSGMVRATDIGSALIMKEINFINYSGPIFDLSESTTSNQLNLEFVGIFGINAGTISGFDVQAIKGCFIDCAVGITHDGTTNKIFIHETPYYGITTTNAAVTFASTLVCEAVDIVTPYFKSPNADSIAIKAEVGHSITFGKLRGSTIFGDVVPLDGIASSDINWYMTDNDGVANSTEAGEAWISAPSTVLINAIDTYEPLSANVVLGGVTERFVLNANNDFVYTGRRPVLVQFTATLSVNPDNNDIIRAAVALNGTVQPESEIDIVQGTGTGSFPRTVTISLLERMVTGSTIGPRFANTQNTNNFELLTCTYGTRN